MSKEVFLRNLEVLGASDLDWQFGGKLSDLLESDGMHGSVQIKRQIILSRCSCIRISIKLGLASLFAKRDLQVPTEELVDPVFNASEGTVEGILRALKSSWRVEPDAELEADLSEIATVVFESARVGQWVERDYALDHPDSGSNGSFR